MKRHRTPEQTDRRRVRKELAVGANKQHDLLLLDFSPATEQHVHGVLQAHTRHTDAVHAHGANALLSCSPGDAEGLRAKLAPHFKAKNLAVKMRHGTVAAASAHAENQSKLKGSELPD